MTNRTEPDGLPAPPRDKRARRLWPRLVLLALALGLGVALVVLLVRSVNPDQLRRAFENVDYRYLVLAIIPFFLNWLLKVPRWALLFGEARPGWGTLFGAMNVGYAINTLLPARLGEIVRAYWVRDRTGIGMVQTLSTIALERVTDGITLIIIFFLLVPSVAFPRRLVGSALTIGIIFGLILIGMIVLALTSHRRDHPVSRLVSRMEGGRWGIVGRTLRQTISGLQVLRSGRAVTLLIVYTLAIWLSNALLAWLVLLAFHINVPATAGALVISVLNLGMAVPSTPGYVGVFDGLMVLTLGLYAVERAASLAAAFAYHLIAFLPATLVGLVYIARAGVQMTLRMTRADEPALPPDPDNTPTRSES